ncbi:hypothetical protein [Pseudorhodoplanes sinuspersici]|uniref:Uncharacterized protein n=1 Tax=Pseudorhodoplanes sinuspersici TaxID=1235591 RepID=A0A1W6ZWU8_9HYPH|nr:hypothetical protein [Pseudorhodoplanes sinuspersici]ARQ01867.1 hypothetical protein CAK95_24305 [Pseudorhodoplanes sinuspersici]RKE73631.1 hypothetical protein DFP91_1525 [Pseudorhodoplanes sinuspersici]
MSPEDQNYCHRLMEAADEFLSSLNPHDMKGAINWGDLGCSLVERVEMFDGSGQIETAFRVIVEEADPGSFELAAAVHNALSGAGFKNIEVQCEW